MQLAHKQYLAYSSGCQHHHCPTFTEGGSELDGGTKFWFVDAHVVDGTEMDLCSIYG